MENACNLNVEIYLVNFVEKSVGVTTQMHDNVVDSYLVNEVDAIDVAKAG